MTKIINIIEIKTSINKTLELEKIMEQITEKHLNPLECSLMVADYYDLEKFYIVDDKNLDYETVEDLVTIALNKHESLDILSEVWSDGLKKVEVEDNHIEIFVESNEGTSLYKVYLSQEDKEDGEDEYI